MPRFDRSMLTPPVFHVEPTLRCVVDVAGIVVPIGAIGWLVGAAVVMFIGDIRSIVACCCCCCGCCGDDNAPKRSIFCAGADCCCCCPIGVELKSANASNCCAAGWVGCDGDESQNDPPPPVIAA